MFVCNVLHAVEGHLAIGELQVSQESIFAFLTRNGSCKETSWYQGRIIQEESYWDEVKSSTLLHSPKAGSAPPLSLLADVTLL